MCFIRCFDVPSVFRNKEVAKKTRRRRKKCMVARVVGCVLHYSRLYGFVCTHYYPGMPLQFMLHERYGA